MVEALCLNQGLRNYPWRYIIPQNCSIAFEQPAIVTTAEAALTFKSTFIIVNLLMCYSNISWGTTFTHLPSLSFQKIYNISLLMFVCT